MEDRAKEFSLQAKIDGKVQDVYILVSESTDGITFYNCRINQNEITQLTKDNETWKQIWGSIEEKNVGILGKAIEKQLASAD